MTDVTDQFRTPFRIAASLRTALASFSVLIAAMGLFPVLVPPGFEGLVPDLDAAPLQFIYAHFAGNTLLLFSGFWLMFGFCTRTMALLATTLLTFYVYLVRVDFAPAAGVMVGYGLFCVVALAFVVMRHIRWEWVSDDNLT